MHGPCQYAEVLSPTTNWWTRSSARIFVFLCSVHLTEDHITSFRARSCETSHDTLKTWAVVKIPHFASHSRLRFTQIEATFRIHHVCSWSENYSYVTESISTPRYKCDLIYTIPVGNSCDILKDPVIKRTEWSDRNRFDKLFTSVQVVGRNPSKDFRCMKYLWSYHKMNDSLLRHS